MLLSTLKLSESSTADALSYLQRDRSLHLLFCPGPVPPTQRCAGSGQGGWRRRVLSEALGGQRCPAALLRWGHPGLAFMKAVAVTSPPRLESAASPAQGANQLLHADPEPKAPLEPRCVSLAMSRDSLPRYLARLWEMSAGFIFNVITTSHKVPQAGQPRVICLFLPLPMMREGILPHLYLFLASYSNCVLKTPDPGIASCKEIPSPF